MINVGSRVRGWTVTMPLGTPDGWHDLLAEDAAGGCVVLRVPPDLDGVAAIRQEAALAKSHAHESLVQSVGLVEHNGWPVQVLEHIDGLTVEELVAVNGPLAPSAVCRIGRQVALALVELHERAPVLCHGSLGPDRVIIDDGGNARLVDIGVARPTSKKRSLSPERRRNWSKPNAADDLWALGMLLADAALGDARVVDDRLDVTSALARLSLPERLADALSCLVAPANARVKNATAAVRIFTEIELRLSKEGEGDGAFALREAMRSARYLSRPAVAPAPSTSPLASAFGGIGDDVDVTDPDLALRRPTAPKVMHTPTPFVNILRDAGLASDEELSPNTIELQQEPRTIEMEGAAISITELRRMAAVAQEAASRSGMPHEDPRTLPMDARSAPEPVTMGGPRPQPRTRVVTTADDLLPEERAALGNGMGPKIAAGLGIAAAVLAVAFALLN